MNLKALTATDGLSAGAWIAERTTRAVGTVDGCIPNCFDAYARILHPAMSSDGLPVSWAHVGGILNRSVHSLVQWHALVGSADPFNLHGSEWDGEDPPRGDFPANQSETLRQILTGHTNGSAHCFFGLWTGWQWVEAGNIRINAKYLGKGDRGRAYVRASQNADAARVAFSSIDLNHPHLRLLGRDYLVLVGPLSASAQIGDPDGLNGFTRHSPNLIWPADRSWFVSSEIDFDSTLVGGSGDLIDDILNAKELEAWSIRSGDLLTYEADHLNRTGEDEK
jgi:hypothetical protein